MKAFKWLLSLVVLVVAVVAIIAVIGLRNLDSVVIAAVEKAGSEVTGTDVSLSVAKISLKDGRAELQGLSIANPQGFSHAKLLDVGTIAVDIDPASLVEDVLVIDEMVLSGIHILAEQKELTKTNIEALMNNINKNTAGGGESSASVDESAESGETVQLAVKKFLFEKSTLKLSTEEWGDATLSLPPIELKNLGSSSNGLTPEQLAEQVTEPVLQQIKRHIGKELESLAKDKAEQKAREAVEKKLDEKLSGSEKEALNQLKGLFK